MNECLEAGKNRVRHMMDFTARNNLRYVHQPKPANETAVTHAARSLQLSLIFGGRIDALDAYSRKVHVEAAAVEIAFLNNWLICALWSVRCKTLLINVSPYLVYPNVKVIILLRLVINLIQEYFVVPGIHDGPVCPEKNSHKKFQKDKHPIIW